MSQGVGSDINISKTQITKAVKYGGSLGGSLVNLGSRLLPMAMPLAKKAITPIATGALSGLASLGVDKIFGKGVQQGGFLIPQNKIAQLIAYKHLLSKGQKKDILNALQSGGQLFIKPTRTQQGGFLGTLLASIGIPMLLNALTGKGLEADRSGSTNTMSVYVPENGTERGRMINPYAFMPPPFIGTWNNGHSSNGTKDTVASTALDMFVHHGLPWIGKKAVEMGRYYGSEALRNPKLQKKSYRLRFG